MGWLSGGVEILTETTSGSDLGGVGSLAGATSGSDLEGIG